MADQLQEIPYKREKGSVLQMGAVLEKDSVNFALEIKEDEKASLLIYKKGQKNRKQKFLRKKQNRSKYCQMEIKKISI